MRWKGREIVRSEVDEERAGQRTGERSSPVVVVVVGGWLGGGGGAGWLVVDVGRKTVMP